MSESVTERMVCGFAHPPVDGTRDREVIDRFRDFLREAPQPSNPRTGHVIHLSAARMYRFHYLIWRVGAVS